jgi:hypothetical protein
MFDVCTTGETAHIDKIFKFLCHTRVNMGASMFFTAAMIRLCTVYWVVPPLPRDLADLKARIIATVKNIDEPMLTRVWQELGYRIVSMCAVSPVLHTSNISSCQKNFFSFPVAVNNYIKVGPLVFFW